MPNFDVLLGFVGGCFLLFLGGEVVVFYTISLARRFKVSALLISMVLIGFSTSLPELFTCIDAVLKGAEGVALGNVIGSNISNVWLIVGGVSFLFFLNFVQQDSIKRDSIALVLSVFAMGGLLFIGELDYRGGIILILFLVLYTGYSIFVERRLSYRRGGEQGLGVGQQSEWRTWIQVVTLVGGIVFLLIGAEFLVNNAIVLARWAGVSEMVIGLTLVAIGTSLPELAAALAAARKGQGNIVLGNVIGSNLYNIFGILGITALVSPLEFSSDLALSVVVMGLATFLLILVCVRRRVGRVLGSLFLVLYGVYLWYLF